jgi:hypothetical protein
MYTSQSATESAIKMTNNRKLIYTSHSAKALYKIIREYLVVRTSSLLRSKEWSARPQSTLCRTPFITGGVHSILTRYLFYTDGIIRTKRCSTVFRWRNVQPLGGTQRNVQPLGGICRVPTTPGLKDSEFTKILYITGR